jgi:hypothetical protein
MTIERGADGRVACDRMSRIGTFCCSLAVALSHSEDIEEVVMFEVEVSWPAAEKKSLGAGKTHRSLGNTRGPSESRLWCREGCFSWGH